MQESQNNQNKFIKLEGKLPYFKTYKALVFNKVWN